jgi:hypothetical protein
MDTDDDGDGMSDDVENQSDLNPLFAGDAGLDSDRDGLTNLVEALAGSNPQASGSVPTPKPIVDLSFFTIPFSCDPNLPPNLRADA